MTWTEFVAAVEAEMRQQHIDPSSAEVRIFDFSYADTPADMRIETQHDERDGRPIIDIYN
jgi:hypothetical protein